MIRKMVIRYILLNKRLFRKYSFLLILCLVPLLVAGMRLAAQEESGLMRVALYVEDDREELTAGILEKLADRRGVLHFVRCHSEQEARDMVAGLRADAAWIIPKDLQGKLQTAVRNRRMEGVVTVVEREDNVFLAFTREILCNALYPAFSYMVYEDFVLQDMGLSDVSAQELRQAYEKWLVEGSLFRQVYLDGSSMEEEDYNYLQAPLRGMLAVWLALCGFAASLYFMEDERKGLFDRIPISRRLWAAYGTHGVVLLDGVIVLLAACYLAGVYTIWFRELICALAFACCVLAFCNLIRLLCRIPERLGSCIMVLVMAMLVLCPVFVSVGNMRLLGHLLPPFYYLRSIHSDYYLWGMAGYTGILLALCKALQMWQARRTQP